MNDLESIVKNNDNLPGYTISNYTEIGIPIYLQTVNIIFLQNREINPINEFILKTIDIGIDSPKDIKEYLGINDNIIQNHLSSLLQEELIVIKDNNKIQLSVNAINLLKGDLFQRPTEQETYFLFDGLLRIPTYYPDSYLYEPREIRKDNIPLIKEKPSRKPYPYEIDLDILNTKIKKSKNENVLRIRNISRRTLRYLKCILIIYNNKKTDEDELTRTRLIINNKNSIEHEKALKETKIYKSILNANNYIHEQNKPTDNLEIISNEKIKKTINDGLEDSNNNNVITIPVYEHRNYLIDSISSAKKNIIIISPWITHQVVDNNFIDSLEILLKKNVNVYIGYGFPDDRKSITANLQKRFNHFKTMYKHFIFNDLGDTHAKILIKDDEYFIITSFNWLSFKGDPKRTYREEWGTKVTDKKTIEEFTKTILQRFNN